MLQGRLDYEKALFTLPKPEHYLLFLFMHALRLGVCRFQKIAEMKFDTCYKTWKQTLNSKLKFVWLETAYFIVFDHGLF